MSRPDFDPIFWASSAWKFMDHMVLSYPIDNAGLETRQAYAQFFFNLGETLPCSKCRENHISFILTRSDQWNDIFQNQKSLLLFYFDMKNHVLQTAGKPPIPSVQQMIQQMSTTPLQHPPPQSTARFLPTTRQGCSGCSSRRR